MNDTSFETPRTLAFALGAFVRRFAAAQADRRTLRAERKQERELVRAVERMADLSPHLLNDIGIGVARGIEMVGRRT
ncbi:hypothetical protein [Tabrizicola sp. BL-A-41-H6]|uniref:hypothetical protein n=1 Tax=Tabrizicola sp. BL-A-41-H6 TaxID=3421107 RepID=UPI003D67066F